MTNPVDHGKKKNHAKSQHGRGSLEGRDVSQAGSSAGLNSTPSQRSPQASDLSSYNINNPHIDVSMPPWASMLLERLRVEANKGMDEEQAVNYAIGMAPQLAGGEDKIGMSPEQMQVLCRDLVQRALSNRAAQGGDPGFVRHPSESIYKPLSLKNHTKLSLTLVLLFIVASVAVTAKFPCYVLVFAAVVLAAFLYAIIHRAVKRTSPFPLFVMKLPYTPMRVLEHMQNNPPSRPALIWNDLILSLRFLLTIICRCEESRFEIFTYTVDGKGNAHVVCTAEASTLQVIIYSLREFLSSR